jgi:hypothetical protein
MGIAGAAADELVLDRVRPRPVDLEARLHSDQHRERIPTLMAAKLMKLRAS